MEGFAEIGVEVAIGIYGLIGRKLQAALEQYDMELGMDRRLDGFQGNFHKIAQEPLRLGDMVSGLIFPKCVVPLFLQRA